MDLSKKMEENISFHEEYISIKKEKEGYFPQF